MHCDTVLVPCYVTNTFVLVYEERPSWVSYVRWMDFCQYCSSSLVTFWRHDDFFNSQVLMTHFSFNMSQNARLYQFIVKISSPRQTIDIRTLICHVSTDIRPNLGDKVVDICTSRDTNRMTINIIFIYSLLNLLIFKQSFCIFWLRLDHVRLAHYSSELQNYQNSSDTEFGDHWFTV